MTGSENSQGFTLVEVLVSFVILSLVAITAFSLLGQSFSATARVEAQQELQEGSLQILRLMEVDAEVPVEMATRFRIVETPLEKSDALAPIPIRVQIYAQDQQVLDSIILRKLK